MAATRAPSNSHDANLTRRHSPQSAHQGLCQKRAIAFSDSAATGTVAIHGVFFGGQDFESALRDTDSDD